MGPTKASFDKVALAVIGLGLHYGPVEQSMAGDPFYKSQEWRDFRAEFRKKHPICSTPGCGKRTSHVDHIRSRKKGGAAFDERNCQSKCWSCHSRKTAMVDGGFGNPLKKGTTGVIGCDADGNPLDPEHHWNRRQ